MLQSIKAFLVFLLIFAVDKAACQDTSSLAPVNNLSIQDTLKTLPGFPGGIDKLAKFLIKNFKVPNTVKDITGASKIIAVVEIARDGSVTKPRVVRVYNVELEKEMLRVLKLMPKWKPGTVNGEPVAMEFFIPFYVHF